MRVLSNLVLLAPAVSAAAYLVHSIFGDHVRRRLSDREAKRLGLTLEARQELFVLHLTKQTETKPLSLPPPSPGKHAKRD
jgi:hypothetical protein